MSTAEDVTAAHWDRQQALDPEQTRATLKLIRDTVGRYFRLQVLGGENIPAGRALIVGCHSGVIPYDAACTLVAIEQETGRLSYAVGDYFFERVKAVEDFLSRHGAIVGRPERIEALLEDDNLVLLFPGGARDMLRKFWRDPYRVVDHTGFAEGRGGYIKIALRTRAAIVPLAVIGAEETHVILHDSPTIARIIGVPFFPFLAFPFPLPVKLYVRFGEPIHLEHGPEAAQDQAIVDELNRNVRWRLQEHIDETRRSRKGIFLSHYENGSGSDSR